MVYLGWSTSHLWDIAAKINLRKIESLNLPHLQNNSKYFSIYTFSRGSTKFVILDCRNYIIYLKDSIWLNFLLYNFKTLYKRNKGALYLILFLYILFTLGFCCKFILHYVVWFRHFDCTKSVAPLIHTYTHVHVYCDRKTKVKIALSSTNEKLTVHTVTNSIL